MINERLQHLDGLAWWYRGHGGQAQGEGADEDHQRVAAQQHVQQPAQGPGMEVPVLLLQHPQGQVERDLLHEMPLLGRWRPHASLGGHT